jgi:hypothetical protein
LLKDLPGYTLKNEIENVRSRFIEIDLAFTSVDLAGNDGSQSRLGQQKCKGQPSRLLPLIQMVFCVMCSWIFRKKCKPKYPFAYSVLILDE